MTPTPEEIEEIISQLDPPIYPFQAEIIRAVLMNPEGVTMSYPYGFGRRRLQAIIEMTTEEES